ncbi:unnamed protein product [Blepharisma stoltei]|uniref:Uncharacterized protein n=1 Tax=Blepharisma stoltei TaxID=1481888 RepID=A0AAU9K5L2_9CILI|nr:unnamed protein product [Blepharisma stoltei]
MNCISDENETFHLGESKIEKNAFLGIISKINRIIHIIKILLKLFLSYIQKIWSYISEITQNSLLNQFLDKRLIQAEQLKEFLNSFLYNIVFSNDKEDFILRQFLALYFTKLFNGTLDEIRADFITEEIQTVIDMHLKKPQKLNKSQIKELKEILSSPPVKTVFVDQNIWTENYADLFDRTYFTILPRNISGITLFGGTILLQQDLSEEYDEFQSFALKITFIHEAAHAMRKNKHGAYNP